MRHEERLIYALWNLRKLLPRMLDAELEALGITMTGFGVLDIIERQGPMSGADLARWEDVRPQTVATLINALSRDGLLERRPHPVHGRVQLASLTDRGHEVWRDASERVSRIEARLQEALGDADYDVMRSRTWTLVHRLDAAPTMYPPVWPAPSENDP